METPDRAAAAARARKQLAKRRKAAHAASAPDPSESPAVGPAPAPPLGPPRGPPQSRLVPEASQLKVEAGTDSPGVPAPPSEPTLALGPASSTASSLALAPTSASATESNAQALSPSLAPPSGPRRGHGRTASVLPHGQSADQTQITSRPNRMSGFFSAFGGIAHEVASDLAQFAAPGASPEEKKHVTDSSAPNSKPLVPPPSQATSEHTAETGTNTPPHEETGDVRSIFQTAPIQPSSSSQSSAAFFDHGAAPIGKEQQEPIQPAESTLPVDTDHDSQVQAQAQAQAQAQTQGHHDASPSPGATEHQQPNHLDQFNGPQGDAYAEPQTQHGDLQTEEQAASEQYAPVQFDEDGNAYDAQGQPLDVAYDESGQPYYPQVLYDEQGQAFVAVASSVPQEQYDVNGQPLDPSVQYDENGQAYYSQIQYDQDGNAYDAAGAALQYDQNGHAYDTTGAAFQYDENGQVYSANGQPYDSNVQYDGNDQPLNAGVQYDENGQAHDPNIHYDENGYAYDAQGYPLELVYDENGSAYYRQIQYDANGQPYDANGQSLDAQQPDDDQGQLDANGQALEDPAQYSQNGQPLTSQGSYEVEGQAEIGLSEGKKDQHISSQNQYGQKNSPVGLQQDAPSQEIPPHAPQSKAEETSGGVDVHCPPNEPSGITHSGALEPPITEGHSLSPVPEDRPSEGEGDRKSQDVQDTQHLFSGPRQSEDWDSADIFGADHNAPSKKQEGMADLQHSSKPLNVPNKSQEPTTLHNEDHLQPPPRDPSALFGGPQETEDSEQVFASSGHQDEIKRAQAGVAPASGIPHEVREQPDESVNTFTGIEQHFVQQENDTKDLGELFGAPDDPHGGERGGHGLGALLSHPEPEGPSDTHDPSQLFGPPQAPKEEANDPNGWLSLPQELEIDAHQEQNTGSGTTDLQKKSSLPQGPGGILELPGSDPKSVPHEPADTSADQAKQGPSRPSENAVKDSQLQTHTSLPSADVSSLFAPGGDLFAPQAASQPLWGPPRPTPPMTIPAMQSRSPAPSTHDATKPEEKDVQGHQLEESGRKESELEEHEHETVKSTEPGNREASTSEMLSDAKVQSSPSLGDRNATAPIESEAERTALQQRLTRAEEKNAEMEAQLERQVKLLAEADDKTAKAEHAHQESQREHERAREEREHMQQAQQKDADQIRAEVDLYKQKLTEAEKNLAQSGEEHTNLSAECSGLKQELELAQSQKAESEAGLAKSEATVTQTQRDLEQTRTDLAETQSQVTQLESQIKSYAVQCEDFQPRLDAARADQDENLKKSEALTEQLRAELQAAQEQIRETQTQVEQERQTSQEARGQLEEANAELAKLREELKSKTSSRELEHDTHAARLVQSEEQTQELKDLAAQLQKELDENAANKQAQTSEHADQMARLQQEVSQAETRIEEQSAELAELRKQADEHVRLQTTKTSEHTNEIARLQDQLGETERRAEEETREPAVDLQAELEALRADLDRAQTEAKETQGVADELRARLVELEHDDLRSEMEEMAEEHRCALQMSQAQIQRLERELRIERERSLGQVPIAPVQDARPSHRRSATAAPGMAQNAPRSRRGLHAITDPVDLPAPQRHRRAESLSMLRARIGEESGPSSSVPAVTLSPPPGERLGGSTLVTPAHAPGPVVTTTDPFHHCSSCMGDLIIV